MIPGNRFPDPKTPEERAECVAREFEECGGQLAVYIKQLRCDFRALKPGETIMNCRTWTEFCTKVLKRTDRAVRYRLAGGNPRSKRKSSESKANGNWEDHWHGMPEFDQGDLRPFKTVHVHFEDQEHVDSFAELVEQTITPTTRFIWVPRRVKETWADKRYVTSPDSEATI